MWHRSRHLQSVRPAVTSDASIPATIDEGSDAALVAADGAVCGFEASEIKLSSGREILGYTPRPINKVMVTNNSEINVWPPLL